MLTGLLLICLAAISWGTTGATMTILARDAGAGPLLVGWARMAVAAPCLLLAGVVAAGRGARRPPAARSPVRDAVACLALGAAMAAYQLCYFAAVGRAGVAVTALLAICSAPLLIALLAALLLGERLTRVVTLSLALGVLGAGFLVSGSRGTPSTSARSALGALLALGAGLSYAAYAVAAKQVLARMPPLAVATATFTTAALLLSPTLLGADAVRAPIVAGWPLLLYLGVGPTAIAYLLFTIGLARVPATVAGIATLLEPLTATTLGVLWFHESLGPTALTGAALLLLSLLLLTTKR